MGPIFHKLGIAVDRIHYEDQSRNTAENAVLTKRVVKPSDGGQWIVITSAFHMPRAIGTFRKAGWQAIPYPVDYRRTFDGRNDRRRSAHIIRHTNVRNPQPTCLLGGIIGILAII